MKKGLVQFSQFSFSLLSLFLISCSDLAPQLSPLSSGATILAFGDSLTFGTGANNSETQSYPAVLAQLTGHTVINSGIPREVSAEGLARINEELDDNEPDLVIVCHGGNDIMRKLDQNQLKHNLINIITEIQNTGAQVILVAVPDFNLTLRVPDLYQEVAEQFKLPINTTIIQELGRSPSLKSDQIHPNTEGYRKLAETINELLKNSGAI